MAHTNSTANYELSQFLGTDKPAWLVDYNGDMLKIDTALKANADAEAASAEDIQELQDAIGAEGLTGRITDIENDIGDIKTEIGSVELPTTAQSLTGAIAELKGVNDDQNTAIGQNATNIAQVGGAVDGVAQLAYTIANVYDSSATYAVGDYAIYQNTLYKCTTAINVGETFDPTKWTSVKVMSEVGQGGGSTSADDVSYDNTSSGLSATNVQDAIDELASNTPDVTVTGDGVKTLTTILNELYNALDLSKISSKTRIVEHITSQGIIRVLSNMQITSGQIVASLSYVVGGTLRVFTIFIKTTESVATNYSLSNAAPPVVSYIDDSTTVVANGDTVEVYY